MSDAPFDVLPDNYFFGDPVLDRTLARRLNLMPTSHFNAAVVKAGSTTGTPGTPTPAAMAPFGCFNIWSDRRISVVHAHVVADGSGGTMSLELWRRRSGTFTRIGTVSVPSGGGDLVDRNFTVTDPVLERWDYLFLQPTSLMTGGDQGTLVDVHYEVRKQGPVA